MLAFVLQILSSKVGRAAIIVGLSFLAGIWTGNSYTVKYYKAKEIAALNKQIEHNKKVIEAQTKLVTEIRDRELNLEKELEEALENARNSPTAGNIVLPIDSVRRLDKIR